jgi:uncharacterized protein YjdB
MSTLNGPGLETQCHASVRRSDGMTIDQTTAAQWLSSDPTVAGVSASGLVRSAAPGSVQIRATVDRVAGSDTITVNPLPPR